MYAFNPSGIPASTDFAQRDFGGGGGGWGDSGGGGDSGGNSGGGDDANQKYTYDRSNLLTEVRDGSNNVIATYAYDALGRRIEKAINGGDTTHFFYDAQSLIEERDDSGDLQRQYVWGGQYIDELILFKDVVGAGGTANADYLVLRHHNFNVVALIARATGAVVERYDYNPYGRRFVFNPDFSDHADPVRGGFGLAIGHQGLMHDHESGLIYNRRRMLHPGLGRFMQRDPLGYVDGMSQYGAMGVMMSSAVDPIGTKAIRLERDKKTNLLQLPQGFGAKYKAFVRGDWKAGSVVDCPSDRKSGMCKLKIRLTFLAIMRVLHRNHPTWLVDQEHPKSPVPGRVEWQYAVGHEHNHWDVWVKGYYPDVASKIAPWDGRQFNSKDACLAAAACLIKQIYAFHSVAEAYSNTFDQPYAPRGEYNRRPLPYRLDLSPCIMHVPAE